MMNIKLNRVTFRGMYPEMAQFEYDVIL